MSRPIVLIAVLLCLSACTATVQSASDSAAEPGIRDDGFMMADGTLLPLHHWPAAERPERIVLGLHGFNDYGGGFDALAASLTQQGTTVYAYDQRGFGAHEKPGVWAGGAQMVDDAGAVLRLLAERYPELPLYLVGKSMGGAVSLLAVTGDPDLPIEGTVLIAPAVWGAEVMPVPMRFSLWLLGGVAPGLELSVELGSSLGISPTDDAEAYKALRADPLVRHKSRVDAVQGLTALMGEAQQAGEKFKGPALILYGGRDEIIPPEPVCRLLERIDWSENPPIRVRLYEDGYHMLTRYSGSRQVHADIAEWLASADKGPTDPDQICQAGICPCL